MLSTTNASEMRLMPLELHVRNQNLVPPDGATSVFILHDDGSTFKKKHQKECRQCHRIGHVNARSTRSTRSVPSLLLQQIPRPAGCHIKITVSGKFNLAPSLAHMGHARRIEMMPSPLASAGHACRKRKLLVGETFSLVQIFLAISTHTCQLRMQKSHWGVR